MALRNPRKTRERLLKTAFEEIHAHGFQGMRVDEVLRRSGLQKGAFYHHFGSKTELGYAVLEEQIRPLLESVWLKPLAEIDDPVREFPALLDGLDEWMPPAMLEHGCPVNNLAQEMASQDEGFRRRITQVFEHWIDGFEALFERGKAGGHIRTDVDSRAAARFMVAAIEGCIGLFKVEQSRDHWTACRSQITTYLKTLGPRCN
ncbi:MAG TPA: TetR/AcrR family transcriptional regulator [Sedimenticola thiotaurini]|uniref:TetR/AcrR family transcriptional regulator n=1 Tax=Sedimenticola thiotaurini TaxID=1543721 RepID=A0A831RQ67_9GAMM|nr:TetR/AcrR family transcriptional regulator [Sedimenticola thiotaurini]